jgi:predicted nucleotidyltransferase
MYCFSDLSEFLTIKFAIGLSLKNKKKFFLRTKSALVQEKNISMKEQEKIIKCLTAFFRRDFKRIRGAALIGSFGRGQGSSTSDIDIELLLENDKIDIEEFTKDLIELFTQTEESSSIYIKKNVCLFVCSLCIQSL